MGETRERGPITDYRTRIMVCGWCGDDATLRNVIEELGGLVVTPIKHIGRTFPEKSTT